MVAVGEQKKNPSVFDVIGYPEAERHPLRARRAEGRELTALLELIRKRWRSERQRCRVRGRSFMDRRCALYRLHTRRGEGRDPEIEARRHLSELGAGRRSLQGRQRAQYQF